MMKRIPLASTSAALLVVAIASLFCVVATAHARVPGLPPTGRVLLGVGGTAATPPEFSSLTGQRHAIHVTSFNWGQTVFWGASMKSIQEQAAEGNYRLMIQLTTFTKRTRAEARTPRQLARGGGDPYFVALARSLNESGQYVYVRPMAEMNGHWNPWCAFNANGTRRNAAHSTAQYRNAFRRIAIIMRGGGTALINTRLEAAGLPKLTTPYTGDVASGRVAMVWNPQGEGSPNVKGNQPPDYYPGSRYVDYVANDLYSINGRAHWRGNEALYNRYSSKPFMIAEWAPWGHDEPTFIARMFEFAISHPRTKAIIYFNGSKLTTFRLKAKPRSLRAYRSYASRRRFRCMSCGTTTNP